MTQAGSRDQRKPDCQPEELFPDSDLWISDLPCNRPMYWETSPPKSAMDVSALAMDRNSSRQIRTGPAGGQAP